LRILLFLLRINWLNYRPADCLPYACFCETVSTGFIRQPINAYTNLGYIIVGVLILIYLKKTSTKKSTTAAISGLPRKILRLFGIAYIAVGIGSFIYHASFIFLGEELDDDSMYMIAIFLVLFEAARIRKMSLRQFLWIYVSMNFAFEAIIYFFPVVRGGLFVFLMFVAWGIELMARRKLSIYDEVQLTDQANLVFLAGYIFWILDKSHAFCYPNSYFQGHAIWHLLTAYAGWMMFKAMDTEYDKGARLLKNDDPFNVLLRKFYNQKW
jgi:uncharacterized protein YjeT (DUF2065 family)